MAIGYTVLPLTFLQTPSFNGTKAIWMPIWFWFLSKSGHHLPPFIHPIQKRCWPYSNFVDFVVHITSCGQ